MANSDPKQEPKHEMRDAPARIPLIVIVFMAIFVPLGLALVWGLMTTIWAPPPVPDDPFASDVPVQSPAPTLQSSPQVDMAAFDARMAREMSQYGWIDREAESVRLPIERAMTLLVERGLEPRQDPVDDQRVPPNPDPDAATEWLTPPSNSGNEEGGP